MCGYICGRGRHIFTTAQTDSPRLHLPMFRRLQPPPSLHRSPFHCVCLADQSPARRREYFSSAPCHVSKRYFRDIYCLIRRGENGRQRVNLETSLRYRAFEDVWGPIGRRKNRGDVWNIFIKFTKSILWNLILFSFVLSSTLGEFFQISNSSSSQFVIVIGRFMITINYRQSSVKSICISLPNWEI